MKRKLRVPTAEEMEEMISPVLQRMKNERAALERKVAEIEETKSALLRGIDILNQPKP